MLMFMGVDGGTDADVSWACGGGDTMQAGEGDGAGLGVDDARPQNGHARPDEPREGSRGPIPKACPPAVREGLPAHCAVGDVPAARDPGVSEEQSDSQGGGGVQA